MDNEGGRFTLIFLGVPGEDAEVELTHNWDEAERLSRRPQLRPPRLPRRRHLRALRAADGRRRHHQPPAARRPHGLRPLARQHLDRAAAGRRGARRPPSRGRRCPTRANGDARDRPGPGLRRQLHLAGPRRRTAARPRSSIPATRRLRWPKPTGAAGASARSGTPTGTPTTPAAISRSRTRRGRRSPGPPATASPAATSSCARAARSCSAAMSAGSIEIPGHTLDHIGLIFDDERRRFRRRHLVRDGLRAPVRRHGRADVHARCSGSPPCPSETRLYCAHEYTLGNARFAAHAEPDNAAIAERSAEVAALRERGEITLPTTVAEERATNPFVRCSSWQELAELRAAQRQLRLSLCGAHLSSSGFES